MTISRPPDGTWAVVPAFDEAATLPSVIARTHAAGLRCLIVDDGSRDGSADAARTAGADVVISHAANRGYADALATGLKAAVEQPGCRWVVTLDADGQLDPMEAAALVAAAEHAGADMGIGIRPSQPRISERLAAALLSSLFGITDPLCGLKAYHPEIIRRFSDACGRGIGMELAVRAARAGCSFVQQRVTIRPAVRHGSRFGHGLWSELRILGATLVLVPRRFLGARP